MQLTTTKISPAARDPQESPPHPAQGQVLSGISRGFSEHPVVILLSAYFPDVLSRLVWEYCVTVLPYISRSLQGDPDACAHLQAQHGLERDLAMGLSPPVRLNLVDGRSIDATIGALLYYPDANSLKGVLVEFGADVPESVVREFRAVDLGSSEERRPLCVAFVDRLEVQQGGSLVAKLQGVQFHGFFMFNDVVWPEPLHDWNPHLSGFALRTLNPPDFKPPPAQPITSAPAPHKPRQPLTPP